MTAVPFLHQEMNKNFTRSNQVKDFSVFDFNYIPHEPLMREECKHLIKEMLRFDMSGIPTHQAVLGSKGSGKTLTLRYLQRIMNSETKLVVRISRERYALRQQALSAGFQSAGGFSKE